MPQNIITEGSITTWNQITVSMSLVGGQSFDACCKPSFLLIIFSSWDFSAPIIYVCKRNQTGQNGSVRFLMPSFDPLCPFPMTQWMPWPNAFTGIGIALSFRLSVQCHTFPLHVSYEPFVRISHYSDVKWASSHPFWRSVHSSLECTLQSHSVATLTGVYIPTTLRIS